MNRDMRVSDRKCPHREVAMLVTVGYLLSPLARNQTESMVERYNDPVIQLLLANGLRFEGCLDTMVKDRLYEGGTG